MTVTPKPGARSCGFCLTGDHTSCPRSIPQASNDNPDRTWHCPCWLADPERHASSGLTGPDSGDKIPASLETEEEPATMAQKIVTSVTSDLSHKEIPEGEEHVIRFMDPDGVIWVLDCNDEELDKYTAQFLRNMKRYLEAAHKEEVAPVASIRRGRRPSGARRTDLPAAPKSGRNGPDPVAVRTWAAEQGIEVKERGRIPATIVAQYEAAVNA